MAGYTPQPIDTDAVALGPELSDLVEVLAAHNHDVWALNRMREGWTHGIERDDRGLTHPGILRYSELSESEKDYDRRSVVQTLKALVALGYEIRPRNEE